MNVVDIVILLLLVVSAIAGFRSGLIQCVFSLTGLLVGIGVASWNYKRFGYEFAPVVHNQALADALCFCLIVIVVMLIAGLLGLLMKSVVHGVGLGWLDSALGLIFGLLRGAVLATLCIVILAAFYPDTRWLSDAQLSRYFLGSAHLTSRMSPKDLEEKIQHGLAVLELDTPNWLRPK